MDPSELLGGRTRETRIRRDASGRWWNGDDPIDHENLERSFDGWIERADDGRLCLSNDINWAYVTIEGPPYFVRAVRLEGEDALLRLSGDREERLDPTTLRTGPDGALYCDVRGGRLAARFDNHAAMQLGERLVEEVDASGRERTAFRLGGALHEAPSVEDPLAPRGSARPSPSGC